jgi:DNA-directed RNA polymerase specialized sigma24 family protein
MELCVLGELTYAEASTALCIPIGTIRSRLSQARKRLRQFNNPTDDTTIVLTSETTEGKP